MKCYIENKAWAAFVQHLQSQKEKLFMPSSREKPKMTSLLLHRPQMENPVAGAHTSKLSETTLAHLKDDINDSKLVTKSLFDQCIQTTQIRPTKTLSQVSDPGAEERFLTVYSLIPETTYPKSRLQTKGNLNLTTNVDIFPPHDSPSP